MILLLGNMFLVCSIKNMTLALTDVAKTMPLNSTAYCLTHLPLDKMVTVSQTTVSNAFSWMKGFVFWFNFHWSLCLRVQLTISQRWFRSAPSHYLNQCWHISLTHICSTQGRWVKTLRPKQNGRHSVNNISKNAFSSMKIFKFRLWFHWSLFLRVNWQ